ncbi:hypothetical protein [Methylophilus aquaticus]|uniref:Uncharacterized protein n=1 Tax=Methylophilus aquaticus TaxID=1971610 RepID=A0ABT9JVB0_9PROT|nr:hypothetical protein [Methylophilus aquaticus]MDP8568463.1 hypothetical protein [Methylophilus aquaticus]
MNIQKQSVLVALTGAIGTLWFEYVAAAGFGFLTTKSGWWMTAWTVLPYAMLFFGRHVATGAQAQRWMLWISLLVVTTGMYAYYQAFFVFLDAQSALIFLFMPLLQSMVCFTLLIVVKFFGK